MRAGASASAAALYAAWPPARAAACGIPSGVQLYTVRDALQRDARATLAALRAVGIVDAELYGLNGREGGRLFGLTAAELKRALRDNGIAAALTHIDGRLENVGAIADFAGELGVTTVIVALPAEFTGTRDGSFTMVPAESRAMLDSLADKLNRVGREYRARGLTFGYHNHQIEFVPVEGVVPYDYLVSRTDPELVKLELDLGWLALAGHDPLAYLRRHAGRVIGCHLKDYAPAVATDIPQRKLVEPGAGTIDFAAVLTAMRDTNVPHGFIEIDVSDDPLGAVERGRRYLGSLACA
jgi:sugar phosphate isomerase/epimerase